MAVVIQQAIGYVLLVTLEVDSDTQYPKGAARVVLANREAYVTAIAMRFIKMIKIEQEKEVRFSASKKTFFEYICT